MNMLYIPVDYKNKDFATYSIWFSPNEKQKNILFISEIIRESLQKIENLFNYSILRKLNIYIYLTNKEACIHHKRNISPTMLMIPFASEYESLIICHSPDVHPLNASKSRMFRHLTHEIVHAINYEKTNSKGIFGDEMRNINIPSWVDEGVAEVVVARVLNDNQILEKYEKEVNSSVVSFTNKELEYHIDNLNSDKRELAFAFATVKVLEIINKNGIQNIFQVLNQLKKSSNNPCA